MATTIERTVRAARRIIAPVLLLLLGAAGCGQQPQVASENRHLILQLSTAASNRDLSLLDRTVAEAESLAAAGTLSNDERKALDSIVAAARADQWRKAEELALALRDGQNPTDEDRERVAKRTLRAPKTRNHAPGSSP